MRFTLASAAALLASVQPIHAQTHYGCWSEKSAVFRSDCLAAATGIVNNFLIIPGGTNVQVPSALATYTRGKCRVQMKAKGSRNVPVSALLSSIDQLISRCQHGWFYYGNDGWLNLNVEGHAGWKRDVDANTITEMGTDFPHGGPIQWTEPGSPESLPLAVATLESNDMTKRQHAKDLVARAPPSPNGQRVHGMNSRGSYYLLSRTAQFSIAGLSRVATTLTRQFETSARDLISDALTEADSGVQIASLATRNSDATTTQAIGLVIKLPHGYGNWQNLFNIWGDGGYAASELIIDALKNFANEGFTSAVYNIWNERRGELLVFTVNRVVGTTDPFPRYE